MRVGKQHRERERDLMARAGGSGAPASRCSAPHAAVELEVDAVVRHAVAALDHNCAAQDVLRLDSGR